MIGEEVRRRREALGLTGAQLAARAGLAPSAVSQIETGKRTPSSASVIKLAAALGVEVGDLYPKGQAPLPEMQEYVDVLIERGFPAKQIAAWLAQDERDEEFIARELEKMSRKDLLEQIMAISPALRKYYRENPPRTDSPARSESA
jgi:transcriptional regulator with XRE-family HTH domain